MTETVLKFSRNVPKRSNISPAKSAVIPMVPFASSHLLGGACLISGLDQFSAAALISRPQQLPQQPLYRMFEHPVGQTSSDQEATSDVHEVCPRQPPTKKRLSSEQVKHLESSFDMDNKLEPERKNQLANDLGLQPRQVAVWYQNKRARSKTKELEHKYDILKLQFQTILAEKQELEAEVFRLRELLGLQDEKIPGSTLGTIPAEKDDAAVVTRKLEMVASVETKLRSPKERQQPMNEEDEEEERKEETAVETEAESVELSCSGTGLSEALDPTSSPSNICDFSQNTSGLTQSLPPFIAQPNFCTDQVLLFNQHQQHMLHQLHQHNWSNYPQIGSVKLENDESAHLMKPQGAEGDQLFCNYRENLFLLQDETDSLDFEFVT